VAFSRSPWTALRADGDHVAGSDRNSIVVIPERNIAGILIEQGYSTVDRVGTLFIHEFKP
jgi:hypothetical protein